MVQFTNVLALVSLVAVLASPTFGLAINKEPGADVKITTENMSLDKLDSGLTPTSEKRETNAERMARGLGPLPPTKRSSAAKRGPSTLPMSFNAAKARTYLVHVADPLTGGDMGAFSSPGQDDDMITFDMDLSRALKFAFTDNEGPFDMVPTDGIFGGNNNVLAAVGRNGPMGQGMPGFAALGLGQKTDDGLLNLHLPLLASKQSPSSNAASPQTQSSTPSSDLGLGDLTGLLSAGSDDTPGQTNIWTFHAKSNRLFAQYTNPDGSASPASFVTGGTDCQHTICLTADVAYFKQTYGSDAKEVNVNAYVDV